MTSSSLFGCFLGPEKNIDVFRSKELALFALLDISRRDCVSLMSMLEKVDPMFHLTVNVNEFVTTFCGEYSETFLYIFRIYFSLIVPKKVVIESGQKTDTREGAEDDEGIPGILQTGLSEDFSVAQSIGGDSDTVISKGAPSAAILKAAVTEDKLNYHFLLSFLLLFMSIPDGNLQTWLYWLCYTAVDKKPDHHNLEELISILWPKTEKFKLKVTKMKKVAQNLLIIVDPSELDPNKLRMFDANTGGAWTRPLLMLRKRIRASSLGYFFWRKVSRRVDQVASNIDDAYVKLKEPYKLSRWGRRNIALTGERKVARKDVRVVVRLHMTYLQLLSEYDGSEVTGGSRRNSTSNRSGTSGEEDPDEAEEESVVHKIYVKVSAPFKAMRRGIKTLTFPSAKIYPSGTSGKGGSMRAGGSNKFSAKYSAKYAPAGERKFSTMDFVRASLQQLRKAAVGPPVIVVDKDEFISLEEKYKESLQMPIDTVYQRVGDAQSRARQMLELCEAEVQQSSFAPVDETRSLRAGAFGAEPGAYAGELADMLLRGCFCSCVGELR
jgi:hypothetical protein